MNTTNKIKNIAITGGTHGNELTGVFLVKKWLLNPKLVERSNFKTVVMHTNKEAINQCRRYIDRDLNRAFSTKLLSSNSSSHYEDILAKEINQKLGVKGAKETNIDFIVDLHTTTSNMGLSIVVSNESEITWRVIDYLSHKEPSLKIYRWKGDEEDAFVDSIAPHGFAIEVGAVPQGVLRADLFLKTEQLVYHILDFFEALNKQEIKNKYNEKLTIYDHVSLVDYPRDKENELIAMIHPNRQDRDFELIKKGDPLFLTLEGETITYQKDEPLYGLFINEAAYYEKGFALCLAKKIEKKL